MKKLALILGTTLSLGVFAQAGNLDNSFCVDFLNNEMADVEPTLTTGVEEDFKAKISDYFQMDVEHFMLEPVYPLIFKKDKTLLRGGKTLQQKYVQRRVVGRRITDNIVTYKLSMKSDLETAKLKTLTKNYPITSGKIKRNEKLSFAYTGTGKCYPGEFKIGKKVAFNATLCKEIHDMFDQDENLHLFACVMDNENMMKDLSTILGRHKKKYKALKMSVGYHAALNIPSVVIGELQKCIEYGLYPSLDEMAEYRKAMSAGDATRAAILKESFRKYFITNDDNWIGSFEDIFENEEI
jgi:hypothetical protein